MTWSYESRFVPASRGDVPRGASSPHGERGRLDGHPQGDHYWISGRFDGSDPLRDRAWVLLWKPEHGPTALPQGNPKVAVSQLLYL